MAARHLTSWVGLGVCVLVAGGRLHAQMPSVESIKPLFDRGNYVFEAILQQTGVVADALLTPSSRTAVARVTRVFACPHEVGNFSGELVTLDETGAHAPVGARSWYFATGWAIGDHVAARVIRRVDSLESKDSLAFLDSLRAAVTLGYTERLRAFVHASDSVVIATLGRTQAVMMDLVPPKTEHPERWARLNVTIDSIRVRRDTSSDNSGKRAAVWVPPTDSTRQAGILVPYEFAYDPLKRPRPSLMVPGDSTMVAGSRRMLVFERLSRRPNLQSLDRSAAGFIPTAAGFLPLSDVRLLGDAVAMPTFTLSPVQECPQVKP